MTSFSFYVSPFFFSFLFIILLLQYCVKKKAFDLASLITILLGFNCLVWCVIFFFSITYGKSLDVLTLTLGILLEDFTRGTLGRRGYRNKWNEITSYVIYRKRPIFLRASKENTKILSFSFCFFDSVSWYIGTLKADFPSAIA